MAGRQVILGELPIGAVANYPFIWPAHLAAAIGWSVNLIQRGGVAAHAWASSSMR